MLTENESMGFHCNYHEHRAAAHDNFTCSGFYSLVRSVHYHLHQGVNSLLAFNNTMTLNSEHWELSEPQNLVDNF